MATGAGSTVITCLKGQDWLTQAQWHCYQGLLTEAPMSLICMSQEMVSVLTATWEQSLYCLGGVMKMSVVEMIWSGEGRVKVSKTRMQGL